MFSGVKAKSIISQARQQIAHMVGANSEGMPSYIYQQTGENKKYNSVVKFEIKIL